MFDFPLQQFDFVGGQVEQLVDAVVDFRFGVGELAGEGRDQILPFFQRGLELFDKCGQFEAGDVIPHDIGAK